MCQFIKPFYVEGLTDVQNCDCSFLFAALENLVKISVLCGTFAELLAADVNSVAIPGSSNLSNTYEMTDSSEKKR